MTIPGNLATFTHKFTLVNSHETDRHKQQHTAAQTHKLTDWLPTSIKEVRARNWSELDVIIFSGDAYVDHPSFGAAVIGRLLEAEGLRVAIVPQPNWKDDLRDFRKLGRPRLFFGVTGGAMDSMVNHYTANKRLRSDDAYTPGGKAGFRPDYAVTVYTRILKQLYPDTPVIIGGIEASLRRLTHYDYWSDTLKPSILIESGADLLAYGMGDKVLPEIARTMRGGYNLNLLRKYRRSRMSHPQIKSVHYPKAPSCYTVSNSVSKAKKPSERILSTLRPNQTECRQQR